MLTNDYNRLQELHAQVREEKLEFKDQLSAELRIINQKNKVIQRYRLDGSGDQMRRQKHGQNRNKKDFKRYQQY